MILTEYLNDGIFIKHYSDAGVLLLQNETGEMYPEPVDLVPCRYTYSETDIPIEVEEEPEINEEEHIENEEVSE